VRRRSRAPRNSPLRRTRSCCVSWICMCIHVYTYIYTYVHISQTLARIVIGHVGWLRLVGSVKLYVSFAKEPYKRDIYIHTYIQMYIFLTLARIVMDIDSLSCVFYMYMYVCICTYAQKRGSRWTSCVCICTCICAYMYVYTYMCI